MHAVTAVEGRSAAQSLQLSAVEKRVLAAISRRPLGLYPAASVARASGTTEAEAEAALERLAELQLITGETMAVECRPFRRETVCQLRVSEEWFRVAPSVRAVTLPNLRPAATPDRLPAWLNHLFWSGDPAVIQLPRDAAFVGEQILRCPDIRAWGWALSCLPREALEQVADRDCTPESVRAMIRNALARRRDESH